MGLAHRIIPTFLIKGDLLVKGRLFASDRVIGHAYQAIMIQAARGVDEMALLDVTATAEGRGPNLELVERLTDALFCPLSVGGGVRSVKDVKALLRAGADKVVIGNAVWRDPQLVRKTAASVGNQAIVVSMNCLRGKLVFDGTKERMGQSPAQLANMCEALGAGEILLQSIDRDGTMVGYDLELVRAVSGAVNIPVIASGGCGAYEDMRQALEAGASAVAAGAMFTFTDQTPRGAAQYLQAAGFEVRL